MSSRSASRPRRHVEDARPCLAADERARRLCARRLQNQIEIGHRDRVHEARRIGNQEGHQGIDGTRTRCPAWARRHAAWQTAPGGGSRRARPRSRAAPRGPGGSAARCLPLWTSSAFVPSGTRTKKALVSRARQRGPRRRTPRRPAERSSPAGRRARQTQAARRPAPENRIGRAGCARAQGRSVYVRWHRAIRRPPPPPRAERGPGRAARYPAADG